MNCVAILFILVAETTWLLLPTFATPTLRGSSSSSSSSYDGVRFPPFHPIPNSRRIVWERQKETRIVGGRDANRNDYPAFVWWNNGRCGGTLISENVVLTAAHCLSEDRVLFVGADSRQENTTTLRRTYQAFLVHPQFNLFRDTTTTTPHYGALYDMSLLVLNEPIPKAQVEPIVLNRDNNLPHTAAATTTTTTTNAKTTTTSEDLFVIGIGATSSSTNGEQQQVFATTLQELNVPYVPFPICAEIYNDYAESQMRTVDMIEEAMICAGGEIGKDVCAGDSGSPLFLRTNTTTTGYTQVGVVSFGVDCGTTGNYPSVFTRVSHSVPQWIHPFICLHAIHGTTETKTNCDTTFGTHFFKTIALGTDNRPEDFSFTFYKIVSADGTDDMTSTKYQELFYVPNAVIQEDSTTVLSSTNNDTLFSMNVMLVSGIYLLEVYDEQSDFPPQKAFFFITEMGYTIGSQNVQDPTIPMSTPTQPPTSLVTPTALSLTPTEQPTVTTQPPTSLATTAEPSSLTTTTSPSMTTQLPLTSSTASNTTVLLGSQKENTTITITINYDSHPMDIQWMLLKTKNDNDTTTTTTTTTPMEEETILYKVPYDTVTNPGLQTISLTLPQGNYYFILVDRERNGLEKEGYLQITKVIRNDKGEEREQLLGYQTGDFDWKAEIRFSLP